MMCVLDPNVLISALLSRGGTPAELLRLWFDGAFELDISPQLRAELERVLGYPKIRSRVSLAEVDEFIAVLSEAAVTVTDPTGPPSIRTADPHDDYLVALAVSTGLSA